MADYHPLPIPLISNIYSPNLYSLSPDSYFTYCMLGELKGLFLLLNEQYAQGSEYEQDTRDEQHSRLRARAHAP